MFKPIRKKINEIDRNAAEALLQSNRRGILAMNGDNGYPYAIPINYFYETLSDEQIARNGRATKMFEITIENMSGKQVQEK